MKHPGRQAAILPAVFDACLNNDATSFASKSQPPHAKARRFD
jgi:hypothetical protein